MLYGIYHVYDVDGGFGDAIERKTLLFATEDEDLAKAYVEKWSHPYVYDVPYSKLWTGKLEYKEMEHLYHGELDLSPFDILGTKHNCDSPYFWPEKYKASDVDRWRVENRPEGWEDGVKLCSDYDLEGEDPDDCDLEDE